MKSILIFILFSVIGVQAQSQEKTQLLKTNTLNLLFVGLPSISYEYQIGKKQSLQANLYKGRLTFLTLTKWAGASIMYRKYFNRKSKDIKGFYLSPGINLHHEYTAYNTSLNTYGRSFYGLRTDIGYQYFAPKSRFVFDSGIGLFTRLAEYPNSGYFVVETDFRMNLSVGIRLSKQ